MELSDPFLKTDMEIVGSFPGHNLYGTYNILCFLETTYIQTPWNIHCDVFGSFVDVVDLLKGLSQVYSHVQTKFTRIYEMGELIRFITIYIYIFIYTLILAFTHIYIPTLRK